MAEVSVACDVGLQAERTALAWRRTALGVTVNAILLLRLGLQHSSSLVTFAGIFLCAASGLMVHLASSRSEMILSGRPAPAVRTQLLATMCAVVGCASAACSMLTLPLS